MVKSPVARTRRETGAVSAEYAAVSAAGVGFAGVLIKFLTSEAGQAILKKILEFFLALVGVR